MEKIVQKAGRDALLEFAPQFAHFNDDVLFGENWNNQDIDLKTRSIITVVALMSSGVTESSLIFHLQNAKAHGVTQKEIAAIITHTAFYVGWPKGWAVFRLAKEVWEPNEGDLPYEDESMRIHAKSMLFPIGEANDGFVQYFTGKSYLAPVSTEQPRQNGFRIWRLRFRVKNAQMSGVNQFLIKSIRSFNSAVLAVLL